MLVESSFFKVHHKNAFRIIRADINLASKLASKFVKTFRVIIVNNYT